MQFYKRAWKEGNKHCMSGGWHLNKMYVSGVVNACTHLSYKSWAYLSHKIQYYNTMIFQI